MYATVTETAASPLASRTTHIQDTPTARQSKIKKWSSLEKYAKMFLRDSGCPDSSADRPGGLTPFFQSERYQSHGMNGECSIYVPSTKANLPEVPTPVSPQLHISGSTSIRMRILGLESWRNSLTMQVIRRKGQT